MDNTTLILIGVGLLLLAWIIYKKFIALPTRPTECETRCVDGVCFPNCNPQMTVDDHGTNNMTSSVTEVSAAVDIPSVPQESQHTTHPVDKKNE